MHLYACNCPLKSHILNAHRNCYDISQPSAAMMYRVCMWETDRMNDSMNEWMSDCVPCVCTRSIHSKEIKNSFLEMVSLIFHIFLLIFPRFTHSPTKLLHLSSCSFSHDSRWCAGYFSSIVSNMYVRILYISIFIEQNEEKHSSGKRRKYLKNRRKKQKTWSIWIL